MLVGLTGASLSLVLSAFATQPWHLVVTLGLLYPLGNREHPVQVRPLRNCSSLPCLYYNNVSPIHAGCHSPLRMVPGKARHGQRHHVRGHWGRRNCLSIHCASLVAFVWLQGSHDQSGSSALRIADPTKSNKRQHYSGTRVLRHRSGRHNPRQTKSTHRTSKNRSRRLGTIWAISCATESQLELPPTQYILCVRRQHFAYFLGQFPPYCLDTE